MSLSAPENRAVYRLPLRSQWVAMLSQDFKNSRSHMRMASARQNSIFWRFVEEQLLTFLAFTVPLVFASKILWKSPILHGIECALLMHRAATRVDPFQSRMLRQQGCREGDVKLREGSALAHGEHVNLDGSREDCGIYKLE